MPECAHMTAERLLPWVVRAAWAALPLAAGPALAAALDPRDGAVRVTASIFLWTLWTIGAVATLAPHPVALTVVRVLTPAAAAAVIAAAATGEGSATVLTGAMACVAIAAAASFVPETALWFVNGPAYANERRLPLRAPAAVVAGPVVAAWAITVGAPTAAVLLVACGQWAAGAVAAVVGLPLAAVLARSLHSLARRWVVFVPAGLVLHDPLALADPVLFPRASIEALRPAPAATDSLDLTGGALGLALELVLREKVPLVLTRRGGRSLERGSSARLLFTPTRPGRVLAEASARRVASGQAKPPPSTASPS